MKPKLGMCYCVENIDKSIFSTQYFNRFNETEIKIIYNFYKEGYTFNKIIYFTFYQKTIYSISFNKMSIINNIYLNNSNFNLLFKKIHERQIKLFKNNLWMPKSEYEIKIFQNF